MPEAWRTTTLTYVFTHPYDDEDEDEDDYLCVWFEKETHGEHFTEREGFFLDVDILRV